MTGNIIKRRIFLMAAALITLSATAAGKVEVTGNTDYGTVTSHVNDAVATITVTPASGYYIRKSDITATRTFMPSAAEARRRSIPIPDQLSLVGNDPDDLSQPRTYTVTLPGEEYDILLEVNYQTQSTLTEAMVVLSETVFVYNKQVQQPTVFIEGLTEGRDFVVNCSTDKPTEPGTYTLTVKGCSVWNGTVTRSYQIHKGGKAEVNTNIQGGVIATAVDEQTVTLTVTPADGYYIRKQDIRVSKTYMPVAPDSRRSTPVSDWLTLEGDDPDDLSLARTYTAKLPGWEYSAWVDATFTQRRTVTGDMVSLSPETFIYNERDQKPVVTVTGLTEGIDYLVRFEGTSWADVATYKVSVIGRSTWKDAVSKTWTITKAPAEVLRDPQALSLSYNGQPQTLAEFGDCSGGTMLYSLDGISFDAAMPSAKDAGTYTLYYMVKGDANHSDTQTQTITVSIGQMAVTVSGITAQDKVYDGTTDVVLVFDKAVFEGMTEDDALTITAEGAFADAQAGTYKAASISNLVLGGKSVGNYLLAETGNQTETYASITPKDIAGASFAEIPAQTFTGAALTPAVEVTLDGVALQAESDYTIAYADNVNAGTATITVTGKGNYQSSVRKTFDINPATVIVSGITAQDKVYDGMTDVVLVFDKAVFEGITEGDALTITAEGAFADAQAGTYKAASISNLVLGGKSVGNYLLAETGNQTETYASITPKDIAGASFAEIPAQTFTGAALTPAVEVTLDGVALQAESDYTIAYADNENAGTATVTVTGTGNYQGSAHTTFAITAESIGKAILTTASVQVYTGEPIEPKVTVTLGEEKLEAGTDYTVAYANNYEAGTATVIVTGTGNYTGSLETTFLIEIPQPMVDENEQKVEAIIVENGHGGQEAVLTELPENFWDAETPNAIPETVKDEDNNIYTVTEIVPQAFKDMPSDIICVLPGNVSTTEGVTNVINGDGTCETLDLTEVGEYEVPIPVEVENIVYTREVGQDEQGFTVCMPYDCEIPEGFEAYTIESVDGQVMFNHYVGILQAYQPYLLKRTVSDTAAARRRAGGKEGITTVDLGAGNVTITPQAEGTIVQDGYELCGTVHSLTHGQAADLKAYTLQPDISWAQAYSTDSGEADRVFLKPFQAYMLYKGAGDMPALSFSNYPASVSATIPSSGFATVASAYPLDCANLPSCIKAYQVTDVSATAVTLKEVTTAVAAGTGLILEGAAGSYEIPVVASGTDISAGNHLQAAVTATPVEANAVYVLYDGKFCLVTGSSSVPAGKAYLLASDVPVSSAAHLTIEFGDKTTGVNMVQGEGFTVNGSEFYNILGQRVAHPSKGLYIVNGKKIIIK